MMIDEVRVDEVRVEIGSKSQLSDDERSTPLKSARCSDAPSISTYIRPTKPSQN